MNSIPDDRIARALHPEYCQDYQAVCAASSHDVHEASRLAGWSLARNSAGRNDAGHDSGLTKRQAAYHHPLIQWLLYRFVPLAAKPVPYLPLSSQPSSDGGGFQSWSGAGLPYPLNSPIASPSAWHGQSICSSRISWSMRLSTRHLYKDGLRQD